MKNGEYQYFAVRRSLLVMSTHDFIRQNQNVVLGADLGNRGQFLSSEDLS